MHIQTKTVEQGSFPMAALSVFDSKTGEKQGRDEGHVYLIKTSYKF